MNAMTIQSQLDQVLAPCPFCGCAMRFRKVSDGNTDSIIHAEPTNCGLVVFDMGTTDESIVAAWNNSISAIRAAVGGEAVGWQYRRKGGEEGWITGEGSINADYNPETWEVRKLYASPTATVEVGALRELELLRDAFKQWRAFGGIETGLCDELAALIGKEA